VSFFLPREAGRMSTEDRIKTLESQIEELRAEQVELNKQLAQAEVDRWKGRIEDLEVQMHLGAMETNDRLKALLDQVQHRWAETKSQLETSTSAAAEGADAVRTSLQSAFKDIRQALLDTKNKIAP
jgi:chromosome segregation ATPase